MYVGVDIGGTKTLVAVLNERGEIKEQIKFATPEKYDHWLLELRHTLTQLTHHDFKAAGIGAPGRINHEHGRFLEGANLHWKNVPLQADCERILDCPAVIENDANLAGLSEAMLQQDYDKVLYITISTGIGTGFIYKQRIDPAMADMEGGNIVLQHDDRLVRWESFASGKALHDHFGRNAADIPASDTAAWSYFVRNLVTGLQANIAITQPDLIVIGGSVGTYFDRYSKLLTAELKKHALPVVKLPKIIEAQRPEEAVIFGCYDRAKQEFGHGTTD